MGRILDYVLGGSTSPMAGDGFGYNPSATRTAAKSPITPPAIQVDVDSGIEEARASSSSNLRSPSLNPSPYGTNQTEHGSSQTLESSRVSPGPSRSPNGIRAPRCSLAISARVTEPVVPSRPSTDTFRTASEESATTEVPHVSGEVSWQEYEIPQELELVRDDTPAEIQNIVQESLDEHRAIRASILQSQVALKTNTISETGALRNADGPAIAECSAMASARSTPDSQYSTSSLGMTAESDTSIESDADDHERLKPASNSLGRPGIDASQENSHAGNAIHSSMTEMEQRFLESKLRSKKGHKLFRRRHDGNSTGEPSLDLPRAEPAISECTGCFEEFPTARTVGLPCRHKYCSPCFTQLITTSIEHEISFAPKCCLTEIPKKIIRDNLPTATRAIFDNKALEYAVPVGNRYYCVSSTCGRWIDTRHAKRKNGAIACQHCKVKLCALCRGPRHASNEECPQDFGLEKTLAQAERAGWRRCHNCRAMVEKNQGCRHITCKCGAQFCYTCGKVWQTCRCTDRDEDRRDREIRARLAQYEANQRAEEEEAKAAAAAIEGAERQLREEREAQEAHFQQEAREIARRETERTQQIAEYFQYLRGVMERVRLHQTWAIDKRHYREWAEIDNMKNQLESPEIIAEREAYVKSERDKIHNSTETTIKSLQRQHAAVMLETMNRHRRDQDDLFARPIDSEDQDAEILKMETLQELIPVQDLERTALKVQQAREVEKWRNRGDASLRAFDSKMIGLKMRLEDAERIKKREMEIRDLVFADGKWTETIFEDRLAMLAEDEQKMVRNGGEAPAAPRRETVTMPSREIPCLQLDTKNQGDSSPATTPSNKKKEAVGLLEMLVKEAADRPSHVSRVPAPRWNRFGDDVIMEERRPTRSSTFVLKV